MLKPTAAKLLTAKKTTAGRHVPANLAMRRRAMRRDFIDARHEKNAIEHILKLPASGESIHIIIDGRFHPCDIIPATRRLSHPATIKRLDITTLSYNLENVNTLCRGIDQGKIGTVLLVPSVYFAKVEKPLYEHTQAELTPRGSRAVAGYVHAKIILMEMTKRLFHRRRIGESPVMQVHRAIRNQQ
jgi:hypothetical protein